MAAKLDLRIYAFMLGRRHHFMSVEGDPTAVDEYIEVAGHQPGDQIVAGDLDLDDVRTQLGLDNHPDEPPEPPAQPVRATDRIRADAPPTTRRWRIVRAPSL